MSLAAVAAPPGRSSISVMVVDDSAVVRGLIARQIEAEPDMAVVASAANGAMALMELRRRSVEEMFRVLRPGGVLALATEFRLEGDAIGYPGLLRWTEVPGASGYMIWLVDAGKWFTTRTNMADER